MDWKSEYKKLLWIVGLFLIAYYLPVKEIPQIKSVHSALALTKWYAQEHVLLCLVPAFFIAGVISVFLSQSAVIKYFGAGTKKLLSYLVASVSGTILAVCSFTILPLFSGIHRRGAGLGPAIAFLYSGPTINILAIILTARILGMELGIARVIGAVVFAVVIGVTMHVIYHNEESAKAAAQIALPESEENHFGATALFLFTLVAILVFVNWGQPSTTDGIWYAFYLNKWHIASLLGILFAIYLVLLLEVKLWKVLLSSSIAIALAILFPENPVIPFSGAVIATSVLISITPNEPQEWMSSTWGFTKQIMPL